MTSKIVKNSGFVKHKVPNNKEFNSSQNSTANNYWNGKNV